MNVERISSTAPSLRPKVHQPQQVGSEIANYISTPASAYFHSYSYHLELRWGLIGRLHAGNIADKANWSQHVKCSRWAPASLMVHLGCLKFR